MFFIGCPMWGYKAWSGSLFPEHTPASEFLRLYSRKFPTVEGNTTFYATPAAETIARWRQETPETFRFCPKISREISHAPRLDERQSETLAFIERMLGLGTRLGPLFLQLPPAFAPAQLAQLQTFLSFWPITVRLAVEVRHADFFREPYRSDLDVLLRQYNVARIIMDTRPLRVGTTSEQQVLQARERKPNLPVHIATTTDFVFVRYIGHPRMEVNASFLEPWSRQLAQWYTQGLTVYVFCHCPYEEHSPAICSDLYRRVQAQTSLPPLPWQPGPEDTRLQQGQLF